KATAHNRHVLPEFASVRALQQRTTGSSAVRGFLLDHRRASVGDSEKRDERRLLWGCRYSRGKILAVGAVGVHLVSGRDWRSEPQTGGGATATRNHLSDPLR